MWLAQVGRERIEEVIDPELTIERALETYAKKGYILLGAVNIRHWLKGELATTYIETPAFAGVSMYCKYNIIHRDYGIAI